MKNAVAVHVLVVHGRALSKKELDHALVPLRWHKVAVAQSSGGGGVEPRGLRNARHQFTSTFAAVQLV